MPQRNPTKTENTAGKAAMVDRKTVRSLVEEEVTRPEVRALLETDGTPSWPTRIGHALRHPLAITLAGFMMTYFVGGEIEGRVAESDKRAQAREIRAQRAYALEAQSEQHVRDFVDLVHRRAIDSNILRSAIQRRSTPELLQRKADYDATYREWNEKEPWNVLGLRRVWAGNDRALLENPSPYEIVVEKHSVTDFAKIDACVTRNFDEVVAEVMGTEAYTNSPGRYCRDEHWSRTVREASIRVRDCALEIMNVSLKLLRHRTDDEVEGVLGDHDSEEPEMTEDEVIAALDAACNKPG